jgi:ABC-2 type transport system permease protein
MKRLKKYSCAFILEIQSAMEYRLDFFMDLLSGCFTVIIQVFLWTAIYGGSQNEMYGYTYNQMIVYVIMAGVMTKIVSTGFEWEILIDIKEGTLSRFLVQPIGYFPYKVAGLLGRKVIHLAVVVLIAIGVLLAIKVSLSAEFALTNIAIVLAVIPVSLMINCLLFYCFSALNFWMTEAWSVFNGLSVASWIFSGGVFPLDVFGHRAQEVFKLLPFQYIIYFPLNIICGRLRYSEIISGILTQFFWIAVLYALSKLLWKLGMKKYIAAGG